MASPAKIREALIELMGAGERNTAVRSNNPTAAGISPEILSEATAVSPTEISGQLVKNARREAQAVQGVDPLAAKLQRVEGDAAINEKLFGEATTGVPSPRGAARAQAGVDESVNNLLAKRASQDSPFSKDTDTFPDRETFIGRSPDDAGPDAALNTLMNTIEDQALEAGTEGVNPNLIRMLSERDPQAAVELMQRLRNQEFNPMMDDIPF